MSAGFSRCERLPRQLFRMKARRRARPLLGNGLQRPRIPQDLARRPLSHETKRQESRLSRHGEQHRNPPKPTTEMPDTRPSMTPLALLRSTPNTSFETIATRSLRMEFFARDGVWCAVWGFGVRVACGVCLGRRNEGVEAHVRPLRPFQDAVILSRRRRLKAMRAKPTQTALRARLK